VVKTTTLKKSESQLVELKVNIYSKHKQDNWPEPRVSE